MSIVSVKASFKNSRISPRAATTSADTVLVAVAGGMSNTLLIAADPNRTYVTIRNTSSSDNIRYAYFDDPNILTEGMLLKHGEAADLESPTAIYARSEGAAVNMILDVGVG